MTFLVYLLVYPILWLISRLPFRLLYTLSDGVFFLLYYAIGYRKTVVRENLALVFPDKAVSERIRIEKAFFKHMCDRFLEMIKTMGISHAQLQKRFTFENLEVLHKLEAQQKSVMVMYPNYASWEWSIALSAHIMSKDMVFTKFWEINTLTILCVAYAKSLGLPLSAQREQEMLFLETKETGN